MAKKDSFTTKFKVDISELKAGIQEANKNIKLANAEFKAASAGMDNWAKSSDGIKAKLNQLGTVLAEEKKKIENYKKQQQELDKAYEENGKRADVLRAKLAQLAVQGISKTSDEYKQLKKALTEVEKEQLSSQKASDDMRVTILNQQAAINKTEKDIRNYEKSLSELGDEADNTAKSVENVGQTAENSSDGFTVIKGAISNLIADGLSVLISTCTDAISSISNLADETREYREDIGKLKTAFEAAGKSTELAKDTYKKFYSVLGEEDRSVEAANHLAKFVETEQDMAKWADIVAGVWGTFGDSLPVEGLTEASNETVRTGTVTGVLADALNWAAQEGETFGVRLKENIKFTELSKKELEALTKAQQQEYGERKAQYEAIKEYNKAVNDAASAEDYFNLALQECTTEQERERLITETLNGLYLKAATLYKENNKSIIDNRKANSDYADSMAELGEELEPVTTDLTEMKREFVKGLIPVLKKNIIPLMKKFIKSFQDKGRISELAKGISNITKKVLPPATKAVRFLIDNLDTIVKVVYGAATAFAVLNGAMKIANTITTVKTAISGLSTGVGIVTKAQMLWNTAMSANPIGAVLTAVGLLTAGIAALALSQKDAEDTTRLLNERQQETITAAQEAAESYEETKKSADETASAQTANVDYVQNNLLPTLQSIVDKNGEVKEGEEARAKFILEQLNEALGTECEQLSDIVDENGNIKDSIYDVINAKKAQILLAAYEENYKKAIENTAEAEKARAIQSQEMAAQEELYDQKQKDAKEARILLDEKVANAKTEGDKRKLASEAMYVAELESQADKQKGILDDSKAKYQELEETVHSYYADRDNYEKASTLVMEGKTEEAISYLNDLSSGFQTVESTMRQGSIEQEKILKEQVDWTGEYARQVKTDYENGVQGVTEAMVKIAEEQAEKAKEQFELVGGNITEGIAEGIREKGVSRALTDAVKSAIDKAVATAKEAADIHSPSRLFKKLIGENIGLGIAKGIVGTTKSITKAVKSQVKSIEASYDFGNINTLITGKTHKSWLDEIARRAVGGNSSRAKTNNSSIQKNVSNNYTQIINAPKAPSRIEIYRQTKNLLALKGGS